MYRSITKRRVGMAAAALLLGGTIGFTGPSAGAAVIRSSFTPYTPTGTIEFAWSSGTAGVVTHFDATGAVVGSPIPISLGNKCEIINLSALSDIISISTSGGTGGVNAYDNGLGVSTGSTNCTPGNGRIGQGQSLTIALGTRFATGGSAAGEQIISAAVDVEGKYSAGLRYSTDGGVTTRDVALTAASDNGSDANSSDNTRVSITTTGTVQGFTSVRFEPTGRRNQAAVAIDNGGDWANKAANKTVFRLGLPGTTYEYTVNCGQSVTADATDNTSDNAAGPDSVVGGVEFYRLANKNQTSCAPIGVTVQAADGGIGGNDDDVLIDNSATSADGTVQNVRARVRITWVVETAGKTPAQVEAELAREINYTPANAAGLHPVQWCTSVPAAVAASPLTALDLIGHPAGEPWCLLSDTRVVSGTKITQVQIYSGNGDPQWR